MWYLWWGCRGNLKLNTLRYERVESLGHFMSGFVGFVGLSPELCRLRRALSSLSSFVGVCRDLSGLVELCRALSGIVGLCRALSGFIELCRALSASLVGHCRALSSLSSFFGFVELCRALSGFVELCRASSASFVGHCRTLSSLSGFVGFVEFCRASSSFVRHCRALSGLQRASLRVFWSVLKDQWLTSKSPRFDNKYSLLVCLRLR